MRALAARSESGAGATTIDPVAEHVLTAYHWPGNVRELENVLNRAYILSEGDCIALADLPAVIARLAPKTETGTPIASDGYLRDQLRAVEARIVQRVLEESRDDRRAAAQRLGIGLSSLYRKLEEFERLGLLNSVRAST